MNIYYMGGVRLGVNSRPNTKNTWNGSGLHVLFLLIILDLVVNINGETYMIIYQLISFCLVKKHGVHISSKNYETSGCGHNLDLPIISYWLLVSCLINVHLRPIHLAISHGAPPPLLECDENNWRNHGEPLFKVCSHALIVLSHLTCHNH